MSRSPLPAWRRLFAAGGGPAATHAALSRAPAPERLMEPLARVRLAAETSLDALARPLDVAAVLSRVLENVSAASGALGEENDAPVRSRVGPARRLDATTLNSRTGPSGADDAEALPGRAQGSHLSRPASRKRVVMRVDDLSTAPTRSSPREKTAFAGELPRRVATPRAGSIDAQVGADARVVVHSPVEGIERLLAIGDPSAVTARPGRSAARTNGPTMEASPPVATRSLASAVDRVVALRAAPVSQRGAARSHAPANNETLIAVHQAAGENRATESITAIVNDAPSNGGFRGLARRTLVANAAAQHIPVRLEPEPRTPSDLPLDTLDARVAESLARILEREARRHGVDLAESRV